MTTMSDVDYGFIKLHRKTLNSQVFVNEKTFKIWMWCLMKANFKSKWVMLNVGKGTTEVEVIRGQFIFGRHSAASELNIKGSTIYEHMLKLVKMGNILMGSNNQYSVITICNYDNYQNIDDGFTASNQQAKNNQLTTGEQVTNTTKKENKEKKEKKVKLNPEYAQFIELFNLRTGKKFKGDTKSRNQFEILLSTGYSLRDIEKATINCFEDEYHQKNPNYLTPEFITREDKLEKYFNSKPTETRPDNFKKMIF
jgi:uncharacterized phage protein (TIGR02220 family)